MLLTVSLAGCGSREEDAKNTASYQQITAEETKSMMEEQPDAVVLDILGYTQIYEFGGIKDWPYEVER